MTHTVEERWKKQALEKAGTRAGAGIKKGGKNSCIALSGKGGCSRLLPLQTMCPNPGEFGEEFYGNGSRVQLLIRLRYMQSLYSFNFMSGNLLEKLL